MKINFGKTHTPPPLHHNTKPPKTLLLIKPNWDETGFCGSKRKYFPISQFLVDFFFLRPIYDKRMWVDSFVGGGRGRFWYSTSALIEAIKLGNVCVYVSQPAISTH